jgi:hypothetical protein
MRYVYAQNDYQTIEEVNAAVTSLKNRLDNNPTDWCVVKLLSGNAVDGWVVPSIGLNDEMINNHISPDSYYNVSSVNDGTTYTAITGTEAIQRVQEMRTKYATWVQANTIYSFDEQVPSNEDMSGYVE